MLLGSFSFAWMGTSTFALRHSCDWQLIALARSSLAFVFALGFAWSSGVRLVVLNPRILWVRSLAGSVSLVCNFFALTRLPQSQVLTLTNTFPLWIALLSWPLYGQRPGLRLALSLLSSLSGVLLIQGPAALAGSLSLHSIDPAVLAALAASVATAVAMMGLHELGSIDTWAIVVHFSAVSALSCLGLFLFSHSVPALDHLPDGRTVLLLLVVGLTATVGQLFLTRAFGSGAPSRVAVIGLTQVVFALLLDVSLWGESFSAVRLVGMALVLLPSGALMVERWRQPAGEAHVPVGPSCKLAKRGRARAGGTAATVPP
jgi:drug/metabolite transporter (DMT)-like permease